MLVRSAFLGFLTATVVMSTRFLWSKFPEVPWSFPFLVLIPGVVGAFLIYWYYLRTGIDPKETRYNGLGEFLVHIHDPREPELEKWGVRGLISWLLSLFGGCAGAEGAAMELSHQAAVSSRTSSSRWFEQQRRSDVSVCMASGLTAAFGAPLAGLVLPVELRTGGRTLNVVIAVLAATTGMWCMEWIFEVAPIQFLDLFAILDWKSLLVPKFFLLFVLMTIVGSFLAMLITAFFSYSRESFFELFDTRLKYLMPAGALIMLLLIMIYDRSHQPIPLLFGNLFESNLSYGEVFLTGLSRFLLFSLVFSIFGTAGMFWPVFFLGAILGYAFGFGLEEAQIFFVICGGAIVLGAVSGAP